MAESTVNSDHTMRLGSESILEERFKVHGRPRKRKRLENELVDEEPLCPVRYVRIDPGGEWLADVIVDQSEAMWCNMLEEVKDVVAESEAIEGKTHLTVLFYAILLHYLHFLLITEFSLLKLLSEAITL